MKQILMDHADLMPAVLAYALLMAGMIALAK